MRISVFNSAELQAVILAMRAFPRSLQTAYRKSLRALGNPQWQAAVMAKVGNVRERVVLGQTARVVVSNRTVTLRAGHLGRALSGHARPSEIYAGTEFGAFPKTETYTTKSRRGKRYRVTADVQDQFRPRNRKGYTVYAAAPDFIRRMASLMAQTVVRTFHEAKEGKF